MNNPASIGSAIKHHGLTFVNRLIPYKVHFIILGTVIAYLFLAPVVYASFFIKAGKPVKLEIDLSTVTGEFKYSIGSDETIITDGFKFHQSEGWVFLLEAPDQSSFEKYLVLNSESRTYFFAYNSIAWPGVQDAYKDLGLDLSSTGFHVLISGDSIRSGIYNIGFLFQNAAEDRVYYSVSNRYLIRTPNQIYVEIGAEPEVNASGNLVPGFEKSLQDGLGIEFQQDIPSPTKRIQNYIDGLLQVSINNQQYNRLVGWAFLKGEIDQTRFERTIVLKSKQNIYYFPTTPIESPSVQKAFENLNLDLGFSGFETYIREDALPQGTYDIGILLHDKARDKIYYSLTPTVLTWSKNQFDLERK